MLTRLLGLLALGAATVFAAAPDTARAEPLRIVIDDPTIEPLPFAVPSFQPESGEAGQLAVDIARVVSDDLTGTGLFREIPASAYISTVSDFNAPVEYADWKAINAQALITGAVAVNGNQLTVKFRLFDVFTGAALGENRKSVALEVTLNPVERTLTEEDLEAVSAKIVAQVEKATGGTLRA